MYIDLEVLNHMMGELTEAREKWTVTEWCKQQGDPSLSVLPWACDVISNIKWKELMRNMASSYSYCHEGKERPKGREKPRKRLREAREDGPHLVLSSQWIMERCEKGLILAFPVFRVWCTQKNQSRKRLYIVLQLIKHKGKVKRAIIRSLEQWENGQKWE